jgi:hypothetical protein
MATTQFLGQGTEPLTDEQRAHNKAVRLQHSGPEDGLCIRKSNGEISVVSKSMAVVLVAVGEPVPTLVDVTDEHGHVSKATRNVLHPVELAE